MSTFTMKYHNYDRLKVASEVERNAGIPTEVSGTFTFKKQKNVGSSSTNMGGASLG